MVWLAFPFLVWCDQLSFIAGALAVDMLKVVVVPLVSTDFDGNEKLKLGVVPVEEVVLKVLFTAALKASNPELPAGGGAIEPKPDVDDPAEEFEAGAGGGNPNPTEPVVVEGKGLGVFCANPNPLLASGTGGGKANPNPFGADCVAEGGSFATLVLAGGGCGNENPNPLTLFVANGAGGNPKPEEAEVDGATELFTGVANPNPLGAGCFSRLLSLLVLADEPNKSVGEPNILIQ